MENTFNVRLSFKGEGDLTFTLPIVGQITIWAGRDIYLKGATQNIINILRQYRSMQLDHKLNGEAAGCYRVIEVGNIDRIPKNAYRPVAVPKTEHISDLKAQMMKANQIAGFDEEILEESEVEEPIIEAGQSTPEELQEKEDAKTDKVTEEIGEKVETTEEIEENPVVEEEVKEESKEYKKELPKNIAEKTVTVGNLNGKKIKDLNARELRKVIRYAKNETEKKAAKTALKILFPNN